MKSVNVSVWALALFTVSATSGWAHEIGSMPTDVLVDPKAADEVHLKGAPATDPRVDSLFQESRENLTSEGRALATETLALASPKDKSGILANVYSHLKGAQILYPRPGNNFRGCSERVLAFVLFRGGVPENNIYLCDLVLQRSKEVLGQTLVHESSHVTGYGDECDATKIEVAAMSLAGRELAFRNGYMERCGLN